MEETYSKLNSTHKIVVTMLQQLVTEYAGLVLATQPCTLASITRYRVYPLVLATQPCTLASTTRYRVYPLVLARQPSSTTGYRLQSVPTGTGYTALYTCFNNWLQNVPAGTGYTAFFNNCLQSVPTGTGYTALYTCFNQWLQSVPAGTGYTAFFNNCLQSVPTGTGYTALCICFNLPVTKYTNRVLATQSLLYSASPQLVTYK